MPPIIIHGLRLFLFILQEVHCLQIFNMTMHYPQWNYITVPSLMFRCVTVSELRLFKRKKKKKKRKMENLQNGILLFLTLFHASNYTIL